MAVGKEIRTQIKSVENTRKITKAMEMVAASKMRKAQDRMTAARPYADKIRNVVANLSYAQSEYNHPFLIQREQVKNVGLIVVTSDKGLCGGLNTNVLRTSINQMKLWEKENKKIIIWTAFTSSLRITLKEPGSLILYRNRKYVAAKDSWIRLEKFEITNAQSV